MVWGPASINKENPVGPAFNKLMMDPCLAKLTNQEGAEVGIRGVFGSRSHTLPLVIYGGACIQRAASPVAEAGRPPTVANWAMLPSS